jgi:hypothetical protein
MSDERVRPIFGEIILFDSDAPQPARSGAADIVDAEFVTLRPDPAERLLAPSGAQSIRTMAVSAQGLDALRKGDIPTPPTSRRGGPLFWTVGLGLAAGAFWVSGGHALVRQSPLMTSALQAEPANPLRIAGVTSKIEEHGARQILFVDGKAVNEGSRERVLPPIEISVTGRDDHVTHYRLGISQAPLEAGGEYGFSSRLEAPKGGVKLVSVAFRE